MAGMQWLLEIALVFLLAATLFHALRLERALGALKRDRAEIEGLLAGCNDSTREAEAGIDRLRNAANGLGRDLATTAPPLPRSRTISRSCSSGPNGWPIGSMPRSAPAVQPGPSA